MYVSAAMHLALTIPGDVRAAEAARHAVAAFRTRINEDTLETLTLLVNELVTNSLLHACRDGGSIELEVDLADQKITASVEDPGGGFTPPDHDPDPEATSGRGLFLVAALSDAWGVEQSPRTRVWFEIEEGPDLLATG